MAFGWPLEKKALAMRDEIQVSFSEEQRAAFDAVKSKLSVVSDQEAVLLGLALLDWAVAHSEDGRFIASLSHDKRQFRPKYFKQLEALRERVAARLREKAGVQLSR